MSEEIKRQAPAHAKPILWGGWIPTEKELPSDDMWMVNKYLCT